MSIGREKIISEVRRTAAANGGKPLGRLAFRTRTGIRESDWVGRYWARWSDVLREAGFEPNKRAEPLDESVLLTYFADFAVELGRVPVYNELRLRKQTHPSFPSHNTFSRLGSRPQLIVKLLAFCSGTSKYATLLQQLQTEVDTTPPQDHAVASPAESEDGFVYMVRMGKHYKIGKTFAVPRRHREIALELPEKLEPVHVIRTDDPSGIEAYWHKRFQEKRTNSEWFALSPDDVRIFKKRKSM